MPTKPQRKGFEKERDLVQRLWKAGLAAMRAPASGARVKHVVYPDVVAMYKGKVLVIEAKYRSEAGTLYVEKSKIEKLREFAERAGGQVLIAVKYGSKPWKFIDPSILPETSGGRLRIDPETVEKHGVSLETLVSMLKGQRTITEFVRRKVE